MLFGTVPGGDSDTGPVSRAGEGMETFQDHLRRCRTTGPTVGGRHPEVLKAGEIESLIEILKPFSARHEQVETILGYFDRNRSRMCARPSGNKGCACQAPRWRPDAETSPAPGSSLEECTGSLNGANRVASLRACIISGRLDDLWYAKAGNS